MIVRGTSSLCPKKMLWLSGILLSIFLTGVSGNTAPRFTMNSSFSVPEDTPVGAFVFQLVAVDDDNDPLSYSIEGENSYYFAVRRETGNVTLKQSLDYEDTSMFQITAFVTDNINVKTSKKITIIVIDRNDNRPIFQNEPYFTDVPENTRIGTPIYDVKAEDADSGNAGRVSYAIEEVIPNNAENRQLFNILDNGTVVLNGSLSYNNKSTFYRIKILAKDNGGWLDGSFIYWNNTAYLSVTIIDVPDLDPEFLGEPYTGSVPENSPLGTSVMRVLAIDRDKAVNDVIYYNITSATHLFAINLTTGVITVSGSLDREGVPGEEVQLEIMAREKELNIYNQVAQVSALVTIQVTDINDNKPQFYLCIYPNCNLTGPTESNFSGQIEEHASARTPVADLHIAAYDPDKGPNGTFQLSLRGLEAPAFSVSPQQMVNEGAVQVLVSNSSLVDYEKSTTMTVEIVANDTGRTVDCCSFAMITIHLLDINDHRPVFGKDDYKLYVLEESPPGFIVSSNITATDRDSGKFGEITYQLLPQSIQSTFDVNATSGTIFVANGSEINWGKRSVYYATLQAMDGGGLTGSTQLEITVVDINNNPPVVRGSYIFLVTEGSSIDDVQIQATDQDDPNTNNSCLQYEILPGYFSSNFSIDRNTGQLVSKGPLDREAIPMELNGRIVVTVLVHDLGIPQLSTTVNVTFIVEDINDNAPRFNHSNYEFFVSEGLQGIFVGAVEATDADQTKINNRISFYIENSMGSNNFRIRSIFQGTGWYQGNLYLDPDIALDYDQLQPKFFNLIVEAENSDSGETVAVATAKVRVEVLDVNDEPPTLVPSPPKDIHIMENTKPPELVTILNATDVDTNHSLVFQQLAVSCFDNSHSVGNLCQDWFLLESNGSLFVNSPNVDYELCTQVEITLRVKDEFTEVGEPYSRNETLRIFIGDENDNAPQFLLIKDTFVIIPEISPVDLQVAVVKATDADSGVNSMITFNISEVMFIPDSGPEEKFENLFKVVTTVDPGVYVGNVQIARSLNSMLKGKYRVTVEAKDSGEPALSSFRSLDIFTVDQSYRIKLKFSSSLKDVQAKSSEIKVILSKATGTSVYVAAIKAEDSSTSKSNRAMENTIMEAYFVYENGTALTDDRVRLLIQGNPEQLSQLLQVGLVVIGPADVIEPNNNVEWFAIIAGLAVIILLLLAILIGSMISMRKSYQRKLKSLRALKVASKFSVNGTQQGPAIPGTNKYNTEGANPVLGFSLDPSMDLAFEENAGFDVASLNSLDENMIDVPNGSIAAEQKLDQPNTQGKAMSWEEPLKAALESRKDKPLHQGKSRQAPQDHEKPCLNTTDV